MKKNLYIVVNVLLAVLTSCSSFNETDGNTAEIRLSGKIGAVLYQTRSGAVSGADYGVLDLGFARVDVSGGSLPDFSSSETLHARMASDGSAATTDPIEFVDSYQTFKNSTDTVYYASWYPYKRAVSGQVIFDVDGVTDVMYGDVVKGKENLPFSPVMFNHVLTKFKIWVYAMVPKDNVTGELLYDPDVVWGKLTTLTIKDVPQTCTITLPIASKEYGFDTDGAEDFVMNVVPASFPLGIDEKKAVAEFMIPPTSLISLSAATTLSDRTTWQDISIAKEFKPGHHYDIVLRFSDHGIINADVKVGEWGHDDVYADELTGEVFYDLSENETANCYVVSSANYNYCFNATVKGNGTEGVVDGTEVVMAPDSVGILWADAGVLYDEVSKRGFRLENYGKVSDGRVMFSVRGNADKTDKTLLTEGNVLLGVYDATGNLLWTWHIWMTDPPQRQGYKNGFSVHDRDLGAVEYSPFSAGTAEEIDGLYYQWGRPTPFPLGRTLSAGSKGISKSEEAGVSLSERIQHPDRLYNNRLEETALPSLWGWRSVSDEYLKTIYDPCPPGYRVPSNRLWRELRLAHEPHIGENGNFHAIHFKVDSYADIFYPVSGYYYVNGDIIQNVDYSVGTSGTPGAAYMWVATYDSDQSNPYNLKFERKGVATVGSFSVESDVLHSYYALPVRCVSRKSTPHVEDLSASQTANSYIISNPGYYKFNAGVRGNGVGKLVSPGSSEFIDISEGLATDISGTIVKVKYLWWQESDCGEKKGDIPVILDDGGMVKNGYVMFHVDTLREGNLIIAGYDESESVILWTWHLWLTDMPKQMKSHNFAVMDRNLGATEVPAIDGNGNMTMTSGEFPATVGLYYQWSRKDPFAFPGDRWYMFDDSGETPEWILKTGLNETTADNAEKTIPKSIQNPLRYHLSDADMGAIPTGTANISSWGRDYNALGSQCFSTYRMPQNSSSLWGYSSASGLGKTTTKTMYDPCPPGYCVTFYTVWTNDSQEYYTNLDSGYETFPYSGGDKVVSGYGIVVNADATFDKTWYPFSGYIGSRGEARLYKGEGRFHSSTPAGLGSRSLYYTPRYTGQAVSGDYKGIPSSFAYPVRCQKQ